MVFAYLQNFTYRQADKFRRIKGADIAFAGINKVVSAAPVEGFIRGRDKEMLGASSRGARQVAAIFDNGIQHLTVVRSDVFHITHVFVTAFNFEGAYASVDQRRQVGGLIVILHRQEMFLIGHHPPLIVLQGIRQAASLRAVAAVGAASGLGVRNVTLPGIGHAQRAMDKEFDSGVSVVVNGFDLTEVQFARQHDLTEAGVGEKLRFFHTANIALGAGVQLNRRQIQLHDPHILDDQRIDACVVEIGNQPLRRLQFIVMQNGVQRHKYLCAKAMSERHQPGDIAQTVAGVVAGAKARSTDVNGIGAVKDRFASDTGVAGRTKKFKTMIVQAHTRVVIQYKGVEMAAIVVRTGRRRKPFPPSHDDEFSLFNKVLTEKIFPSNHGEEYCHHVFRIFLVTL